jgi:hypothetical protein
MIMKNIDEEMQDESIDVNDCSTELVSSTQLQHEIAQSQMRVSLVPLSSKIS